MNNMMDLIFMILWLLCCFGVNIDMNNTIDFSLASQAALAMSRQGICLKYLLRLKPVRHKQSEKSLMPSLESSQVQARLFSRKGLVFPILCS